MFALVLAIKVGSGGNGVRITTLIFAIVTAILGLYPFILVGLVHTVLAILVAVFVGNSNRWPGTSVPATEYRRLNSSRQSPSRAVSHPYGGAPPSGASS
ncbi:hypothetical protein SVIOM342S_04640 [Streptomyces violaceorubidus]